MYLVLIVIDKILFSSSQLFFWLKIQTKQLNGKDNVVDMPAMSTDSNVSMNGQVRLAA